MIFDRHFFFSRPAMIPVLLVCLFLNSTPILRANQISSANADIKVSDTKNGQEAAKNAPAVSPAAQNDSHSSRHSPKPCHLFNIFFIPVTNSMISTWVVAALMIIAALFFKSSLKRGRFKKFTGLVEFSVSSLLIFFEELIGGSLVRKTFWFLASIFFFILFLNWAELLPGVGSIGWGKAAADGFLIDKPIFRGATADLNMTLALGALFFIFWLFLSLKINGVKGFILHIFGPKGESNGFIFIPLIIVFIAVGFLEVVSIIVRPFSLALRLYGNTFAGEVLLDTMMKNIPALAWIVPIPFYFMETLVGFVQAFVFTLLSAVFIMLSCSHEDAHETGADLQEACYTPHG
jgi:F-type H+-transporting ATPase subunit a